MVLIDLVVAAPGERKSSYIVAGEKNTNTFFAATILPVNSH